MKLPTVSGVTPYLSVRDARAAAELYQRAFGAEVLAMMPMGDKIIHGHLRINGGPVFLCDPFPEHGHPAEKPQAFVLHLQVDSADAWWKRAVEAGCEPVVEVKQEFWGDRYGQVRDPFGVLWSIGSTPS
jgi:PhnB protein